MVACTNDWKIEAKSAPEPKCEIFYSCLIACGTDGKNYVNISYLKCKQGSEYGKHVNLQLKHTLFCE